MLLQTAHSEDKDDEDEEIDEPSESEGSDVPRDDG